MSLALTIFTGASCAFLTAFFSAHFAAKHVKTKADQYFGELVNRVSVLESRTDEIAKDKTSIWREVSKLGKLVSHTRGRMGLNGSTEG